MKFDEALVAHSSWKRRLTDYIDGRGKEPLVPSDIERDDACELGQWIRALLASAHPSREIVELARDHSRFHRVAADVVRACDAGDRNGAHVMLAISSEYALLSARMVMHIRGLRQAQAA